MKQSHASHISVYQEVPTELKFPDDALLYTFLTPEQIWETVQKRENFICFTCRRSLFAMCRFI